MNITISGPGGPGPRYTAISIIRAINSPWLVSVTSTGSSHPPDNDYTDVLLEVNAGKTSNIYGDVSVSVHHLPWGG